MTDGPADPTSPQDVEAIQLHETLEAYIRAGFTRAEAMKLIVAGFFGGADDD